MIKKNKIFIIGIIITLIVLFVILSIRQQKKMDNRPFKQQIFTSTTTIENYTEYDRLDTVLLVLSEKVYDFDSLDIKVYYLPKVFDKTDLKYGAIVQHAVFGSYLIYLDKDKSLSSLKNILSHEFIHINQYENGDLLIEKDYAIWKGDTIYPGDMDYRDRPFEKEAFGNQNRILKRLNDLLY